MGYRFPSHWLGIFVWLGQQLRSGSLWRLPGTWRRVLLMRVTAVVVTYARAAVQHPALARTARSIPYCRSHQGHGHAPTGCGAGTSSPCPCRRGHLLTSPIR